MCSSGDGASRLIARSSALFRHSLRRQAAPYGRWSPYWSGVTLHVNRKSSLLENDSDISELSSKNDTLDISVLPEMELSSYGSSAQRTVLDRTNAGWFGSP